MAIKSQITYEDFDKVDIRPDDETEDESNWVALIPLKEVPLGRGVK